MTRKDFDYIAIDFETANSYRGSAFSVGIACFKDGECVDQHYHLIRPKELLFHSFNTMLHGIDEEAVRNEPEFDVIFNEKIKSLIENQRFVTHNAAFDMSILRYLCADYNLPLPELEYLCSSKLAKLAYPTHPSYSPDYLCQQLNIELDHHHALSDAIASGMLLSKTFTALNCTDFNDVPETTKIKVGYFRNSTYSPCSFQRIYTLKEYEADPSLYNESSQFFGKKVLFTGALSSMSRAEAQKIVLDIGGFIGSGVTADTNYLVLGIQDYSKFGEGFESAKLKKAKKFKAKGSDIEIISEVDFFREIEPSI